MIKKIINISILFLVISCNNLFVSKTIDENFSIKGKYPDNVLCNNITELGYYILLHSVSDVYIDKDFLLIRTYEKGKGNNYFQLKNNKNVYKEDLVSLKKQEYYDRIKKMDHRWSAKFITESDL